MQVEAVPEWTLGPLEGEIAALLARCFATDFGGRSFFQQRHHLRLLARDGGGALVGHLALQWRAVRLGGRLVTVAGLAEVATTPEAREQGVARALVDRAVGTARDSGAGAVLLFGTATLYAAAGFRPAPNPLIWTDMEGARTGAVLRRASGSLRVLPLGPGTWPEEAELDLLGPRF
jgi:predicted N-acetyltransferase YhbS